MNESNLAVRTASTTDLLGILNLLEGSECGGDNHKTELSRELSYNISRGLCLVAQKGEKITGAIALREKFLQQTQVSFLYAIDLDQETIQQLLNGAKSLASTDQIFMPIPSIEMPIAQTLLSTGFEQAGSVKMKHGEMQLISMTL